MQVEGKIVIDMLEDYIQILERLSERNSRETIQNNHLDPEYFKIMNQTLENKKCEAEKLVSKLKEDLNILNSEDEEGIKYV